MTQKVLIVVHQEHSTPGKVGDFLARRGYSLDRRCPNLGDPLPANLDSYAAAVIFGGPMSANDDHLDGIKAELDWLETCALPSDCPMVGICLGAQEIARVLGAKVGPHPDGLVEIGYVDVQPTGACTSFMKDGVIFYQWHSETFDIPQGAVHLAENDPFPGQAFRYGDRVYGIEFHPEMTKEMIERWSTSEKGAPKIERFKNKGAQPREAQLEGYERHAEASDRWLDHFLDKHLLIREASPARAAG
ncbi:MAG: glutamine amidotransferase-related protein [Geminicoccaceae bacterium]